MYEGLAYDIEGGRIRTELEAVTRARQFKTIVAQKAMYKQYAAAMLAAHASLRLLVYQNGTHTNNPPGSKDYLPLDWYVRDKDGTPIRAGGDWPGNYAMSPISGWGDFCVLLAQNLVSDSGFNGVYVDEMGTGPITNTSNAPLGVVTAIDPRTGLVWDLDTWVEDMCNLLARIRSALPDDYTYCNGLGNGARFFASKGGTAPLLDACDGAVCEQWIRSPGQLINDWGGGSVTAQRIRLDRDLAMCEEAGAKFLGITKTWTPGTEDQKERWHRYSMGAYLLAMANGADYYFTPQRAVDYPTPYSPLAAKAKQLGKTVGPRTDFRRVFEHGSVILDPVGHDALITVT